MGGQGVTENREVVTEGVLIRLLGNNPDLEGHKAMGCFPMPLGEGLHFHDMFTVFLNLFWIFLAQSAAFGFEFLIILPHFACAP